MRRLGRLFVALAITLVVPACSSDGDVDEMATDGTNFRSTPGDDSVEAGFARDMDMETHASMAGSTHLDPDTGLMPGMATRPQVTALRDLPIADAEVSFLQLMIDHHLGGVDMAEVALGLTDHPSVVRLASSIVASQQAEIAVMTEMLAKRGVTS